MSMKANVWFTALAGIATWIAAGCSGGGSTLADAATDGGPSTDAVGPGPSDAGADAAPPLTKLENLVYVEFILNTHDWVFLDNSIATVNKVIDLHEKYNVPVEIYLTDPMIRMYVSKSPALVERLKTSSVVSISHHVRPPAPYYSGYDWYGLDKLTDTDLKTLLTSYEEHAIDLKTGLPSASEAGGYEFLKKTIGYAPYVVTMSAGTSKVAKTLADIYKSKGALFTLTHSEKGTAWGETSNGLLMRPETVEVKAYEIKDDVDFEAKILNPAMEKVGTTRPAFMNLKWHEDNFYTSGTPWGNVYYSDARAKTMKPPPYDTTAYEPVTKKTETEKATQLKRYETALQYMLAHSETYRVIGIRDLKTLAGL
jgi:hypothetical protein